MHVYVAVLVSIGLLIVVRLLTLHSGVRGWLRDSLSRLGHWLLDRLTPAEEVDELAAELWRAVRLERLRADVRRLQRILVTDMSMSATRQMGNRLAYDWLIRELDKVTRESPWTVIDDPFADEVSSAAPSRTRDALRSSYAPRVPQVEVLEIGRWR